MGRQPESGDGCRHKPRIVGGGIQGDDGVAMWGMSGALAVSSQQDAIATIPCGVHLQRVGGRQTILNQP